MTPHLFGESLLRGELAGGPLFAALVRWFDGEILRLAGRHGAVEQRYPAALPAAELERLGYFEAFGDQATRIEGNAGVLNPAICYHLFASLRRTRLPEPVAVTAAGPCFRNEKGLSVRKGRLRSFTMREIVFAGPAADVVRRVRVLPRAALRLLASAGLDGELAAASDSFFLGEARGREILQKLAGLKSEIRCAMGSGAPIAVASFNQHRDFFGKRMRITHAGGSAAHSACAAFGLERLAMAFLHRHGPDTGGWPPRVSRFVSRHAAR